jgi:hypothetical protein
MALYPRPSGHAGHRLLALIQEVDPSFGERDYLQKFRRENLWKAPALPEGRGRTQAFSAEGEELFARVVAHYDDVVLFGAQVWHAVTASAPPKFFGSRVLAGTRFWYMPHPSGVNRVYNNPDNRRCAGELLLQLAGIKVPA